jgi:peptidylprolyl isomerase
MLKACTGNRVRIAYKATMANRAFAQTDMARTAEFTLGKHQVITGIEQAVTGMEPGEKKKVIVPAELAFGVRRPELVSTMPRNRLPRELSPEIGRRVMMTTETGEKASAKITGISGANVTLDANHPLAGNDLRFEIKLLECREETLGSDGPENAKRTLSGAIH